LFPSLPDGPATLRIDPVSMMGRGVEVPKPLSWTELLWASSRELLNIARAEDCGCHIIPQYPILSPSSHCSARIRKYSVDTVKTFYEDARAAGFKLV
jgi:transaldolase